MIKDNQIDYIEIPASDIDATKNFFSSLMGWKFEDFGPAYSCFDDGRLKGGFYLSEKSFSVAGGSPLLVFYSSDLEQTLKKVKDAGGVILKEIFSFPGGRRFHFADPSKNEFAFWSEK